MATQQCTCFYFEDAPKAVDLLTKAAQFKTLFKKEGPGGVIQHCELSLGPVIIMLGTVDTSAKPHNVSSLKNGEPPC